MFNNPFKKPEPAPVPPKDPYAGFENDADFSDIENPWDDLGERLDEKEPEVENFNPNQVINNLKRKIKTYQEQNPHNPKNHRIMIPEEIHDLARKCNDDLTRNGPACRGLKVVWEEVKDLEGEDFYNSITL